MTSTDTPVIAIVMQGNHKDRLKIQPYAYFVSYEAPFDLTLCLVKTEILNNRTRRKVFRDMDKEVKKLTGTEPVSMIYFSKGADVSKVHEFLNIQLN